MRTVSVGKLICLQDKKRVEYFHITFGFYEQRDHFFKIPKWNTWFSRHWYI